MKNRENAREYTFEELYAFGESEASRLREAGYFSGRRAAGRIRSFLGALSAAHPAADAGEWLSDNRYLIEREALLAAKDFTAARRVPAGRENALIAEAAASLAAHLDGEVTPERAAAYFEGFQSVRTLSLTELTLLGAALRSGLVELLAEEYSGSARVSVVSAAITSLRELATADLSALTEKCDKPGAILSLERCGVYPRMDERTRAMYRRRLARMAEREGVSESELARRVLDEADAHADDPVRSHVGWQLFEGAKKPASGALYALGVLLITLAIAALCAIAGGAAGFVLALLPASEIAKNALDALLLRFLPRRLPPRMDMSGGVPDEGKTVCCVSAILAGEKDGPELARRLEEFACASRECGKNLMFAVLADLPEAKNEHESGDAAAIDAAKRAVDELNARRGGGFYLLVRARREAPRDRRWRGYERKRGALLALAELCAGDASELAVLSGDAEALRGARYILTLDADTRLLPGAARELIGAMLHPLNRAEIDRERGVVRSGRGIIHPRIGVELAASGKSAFARISAGPGGVDPYNSACGEVWMDLTGRGGFAGKGIIDVAALLTCSAGLPEGLVLSHDAIEGALLRGGYMSDTLLTDGCPATGAQYFRRAHRWVRGDWQNAAVLLRLWRRISIADRLRLIDSLRRSLVAPAALAAIIFALIAPRAGLYAAAIAAVLSLCSGLAAALVRTLTRRTGREKHPGGALYGAALSTGRAVLRLLLLPWEAWIDLSAAACALWRVLVSHRRLLEWQTSAQSAKGKSGIQAVPCLVAGAALVLASPSPIGMALGIVWLFAPLFAASLGVKETGTAPPNESERRFLLGQCAMIWSYFDEYCTRERGYLPPDNVQAQPPVGAAERTSPTNIGLALVSCLAAADLGVATKERALELIDGILATCEKLEKWHGHLYNWYDTRTRSPLEPRYVSTVDSGNLAASLTCLAAGLREYGRGDAAERAIALRDGMDFAALYDGERRLFRIGYNATTGEADEGCYDLLASEARLTGYYAVAHGDVPVRHWRQLSRALVGKDGYRGLASWTGTMFEYLMPELYLPLERGSLLWESARFCLYAQRHDVPHGVPWGESESAFFALDSAMNYRYKAHGAPVLALRRGMDADKVCAPYASYLALAVEPHAAVRNLRRFAAMNASGRYGLWEAVDFTPRRCAGKGGEAVCCVMAHHLGMSLISAANFLLDGIMRRRFMGEAEMAAYQTLLGESAPEGAVLLRRRAYRQSVHERLRPYSVARWEGECRAVDEVKAFPISNGVYSVLCTQDGLSRARAGGICVYRGFDSSTAAPTPGLRFTLRTDTGDVPVQPLPGEEGGFMYKLHGGLLRFDGERGGVSCTLTTGVPAGDTAELRIVELSAAGALDGTLTLEFEPVLARYADYEAHPAYWRLGLTAKVVDGALLIRRIPRSGLDGCWLCLASDADCTFRANVDGEPLGALAHPYVTAEAPVDLEPGGVFRARFAIAFAATEQEALASAQRTLLCGAGKMADLVSALGAVGGITCAMLETLPVLAGRICFPRIECRACAREDIWAAGVPGDHPIVAVRADNDASHVAEIAARHTLLRRAGVLSELVFLTDGGGYQREAEQAVRRALAKAGLDGPGDRHTGIYCADVSHAAAIEGSAAVLLEPDGTIRRRARREKPAARRSWAPRRGGNVGYTDADGEFSFTVSGALPRRAWTLPMSNGRFGYIAADCGLGNMWTDNAREKRINAWICDERAAYGPETLEVMRDGSPVSLFAAEDGIDCRVTFGLGWARWEKLGARVTAFVAEDTAARVLIIEGAPGNVRWHTGLWLGAEAADAAFITTRLDGGVLYAENPRTRMSFAAAFSTEALGWTCDEGAHFAGKPANEMGEGFSPCFSVTLPRADALVIACGSCSGDTLRALAEPESAARELRRVRERFARLCRGINIDSPDAVLNEYVRGGWAVYQTLACRMLARASIYQSGGAFGFRDQLQDAANLLCVDPNIARERILDACAHQYAEGDVMHWWHPGAPDKGVRTRISDDLIWLPWALCEYLDATHDEAILAERVRGISSAVLAQHEETRYEEAAPAPEEMSVLAHAAAALQCVLRRGFGAHGLLLMGSGDWCDGFDAVRGESVWLTEFFAHTAQRFVRYLDTPSAAALTSAARRCVKAVEAAWDGEWYRRGYFADGRPLGSRESAGCRVDAIAQAWAVFAGCDRDRCVTALRSAVSRLADTKGGVVKLFDPPFGDGTEYAGYVNSYGEGFRENGGQYTHGAVWLALACYECGLRAEGEAVLSALMRRGERYGAEPFVIAADVYSNPARYGEAGWSWYTGSAGWMLRAARKFWGVE